MSGKTGLPQPVIVDNRPGATGALGSSVVANAAPDGYTLLVGFLGSMILLPLLNKRLTYDGHRDFKAVGKLATYDFVIVARPSLPVFDLASVLALARSRPQSVAYGSTGVGSPGHMALEDIGKRAKVELRHVPYKGDQAMLTDLLGNHIEMGVLTLTVAEPHLKAGKLKAIAIATSRRSSKIPATPTLAEAGYPEAGFETWAGLMAPKATPDAIVSRLDAALLQVLKDAKVQAELAEGGFTPAYSGPAVFAKLMDDDRTRYAQIIEKLSIQID